MIPETVNHLHAYAERDPQVNVKLIKNTKGYNWEITVTGAKDNAQALALIAEADAQLREMYPQE